MNAITKRLQEVLEQRDVSYRDLEKLTGVSRSTLYRYFNDDTARIPVDKLQIIADALNVDAAYLIGWQNEVSLKSSNKFDNILPIETKRFPLLGEIACGQPIFTNEDRESYVEAGTNIKADFCLKCRGNSMINARINDGDIVFVRSQPTVNNGEIAAVVIDDEATLKRVYQSDGYVTLMAENPEYAPIVVSQDDGKSVYILGKAVAFQSDIK